MNGQAEGAAGIGVYGAGAPGGVVGATSATNRGTAGVFGASTATSGSSGVGVMGQAWSPQAIAGLFVNAGGGAILVGDSGNPGIQVFRVDGTGRVYADGGFQPSGADFAESMAVRGDRTAYAAGDLLVIDPSSPRRAKKANQPYSTLVAGIHSTKPGLPGTTRKVKEFAPEAEVPLAVAGIVDACNLETAVRIATLANERRQP